MRAVRKGLGGIKAWVCSAEDLIIQKAVAGRGRDWPDIEALLIEQRKKWMTLTLRIGTLGLQKFWKNRIYWKNTNNDRKKFKI